MITDDGTDRHRNPTTGPYAGKWATPTWSSWHNARKRCYTPSHNRYNCYGAVGVVMADRWNDLANFIADMGLRPEGTELGRYGDVGNYEPGNCAWMTPAEQLLNKKKAS